VKTIWKFPLALRPRDVIEMPQGAEILSCGWQGESPMLWALVDPYAPKTARLIVVMPTGAQCDFAGLTPVSLGRIEPPGTGYIFHLFDLGEKPITPFSEGTPE
jgi:hypothetical protein